MIIIPGGRANLVAYKLRRDPRLKRLCQVEAFPQPIGNENRLTGWRFLKARHLRWLVDNAGQIQQPFDELLRLDPLTFTAPQMRLL